MGTVYILLQDGYLNYFLSYNNFAIDILYYMLFHRVNVRRIITNMYRYKILHDLIGNLQLYMSNLDQSEKNFKKNIQSLNEQNSQLFIIQLEEPFTVNTIRDWFIINQSELSIKNMEYLYDFSITRKFRVIIYNFLNILISVLLI